MKQFMLCPNCDKTVVLLKEAGGCLRKMNCAGNQWDAGAAGVKEYATHPGYVLNTPALPARYTGESRPEVNSTTK